MTVSTNPAHSSSILIDKVQDCRALSSSIWAIARTIEDLSGTDPATNARISEFHLAGLNLAVVFLIDYQSRKLETVAELLNQG